MKEKLKIYNYKQNYAERKLIFAEFQYVDIASILRHHTSKYNNGNEISKKLSRYVWGLIKTGK